MHFWEKLTHGKNSKECSSMLSKKAWKTLKNEVQMGQFALFASNFDRFALCTELSSQFVAFSQRMTQ